MPFGIKRLRIQVVKYSTGGMTVPFVFHFVIVVCLQSVLVSPLPLPAF